MIHTARARAYVAYVGDNPHPGLAHRRVDHSEFGKEGLARELYMDEEDGPQSAKNNAADTSLTASTQLARGYIANLQELLFSKWGRAVSPPTGLEGKQRRSNWVEKEGRDAHLLESWAEVEGGSSWKVGQIS